jgi:hypothetical protein
MSAQRFADWLLGVAILVNIVLALVRRDWGQAVAWFVAGLCLVQACMWRALATSWKEVTQRGRT